MESFQDCMKLCERSIYTIDVKRRLIGKEFTYKGRQMVVVDVDPMVDTVHLARLVRGKPENKWIPVGYRKFEKFIKNHLESIQFNEDCSCPNYPAESDDECPEHKKGALPPFYGKGDGESAAEISTAPPSSSMESKSLSGRSLNRDIRMISSLCESANLEKFAKKYFNTKTKFVIKNKNIRAGYISGYEVGQELEIERNVTPKKHDLAGNFLERQVNLSVPAQRIQTAVKVKNLIYDVLDGTLIVNGSKKDTAEFKKWSKELTNQ